MCNKHHPVLGWPQRQPQRWTGHPGQLQDRRPLRRGHMELCHLWRHETPPGRLDCAGKEGSGRLSGHRPGAAPCRQQDWNRGTGWGGWDDQGLFLGTWLETHTLTMSRDVKDIHGDRADFASGEEVRCHFFIGLFWRKKGLLAFFGGRPQPSSKSPPKKSKRSFFPENEPLK